MGPTKYLWIHLHKVNIVYPVPIRGYFVWLLNMPHLGLYGQCQIQVEASILQGTTKLYE